MLLTTSFELEHSRANFVTLQQSRYKGDPSDDKLNTVVVVIIIWFFFLIQNKTLDTTKVLSFPKKKKEPQYSHSEQNVYDANTASSAVCEVSLPKNS